MGFQRNIYKYRGISTSLLLFWVLLCALVSSKVTAQTEIGSWNAYLFNARFAESAFRFQFDAQYRNYNLDGDLNHIIIRPGIQYFHEPSRSSYLAGYAYFVFGTRGNSESTTFEHRLFQDIDLRQRAGRVALRHRFRFEERFRENLPYQFRARYTLFAEIPLNKKEMGPRTWYLPLFNEVFVVPQLPRGTFFDRNWLYGGVGYRFHDRLAVQAGYMQQLTSVDSEGQLWLSLHMNMHWFKD